MLTEIKMPKEINTLQEFNKWGKSLHTDKQDFEILMKRRPNFHPFDFREHKDKNGITKIHYLIDDGVSSGYSQIENFNRIFKFRIRKYTPL